MTTAHRPTWNAAIGGTDQGGARVHAPSAMTSAKDAPAHLKMKYRQPGQGTKDEISKKDFRRLLEEREAEHRAKLHLEDESIDKPKLLTDKDGDVKMEASSGEESNFDDEDDEDDSDSNEDSDDSDDDEEEELRRELERIKRERLEEKKRQELERLRQEQEDQDEMIMQSNPLLNSSEDSFNVKRKWYEDTVFRNQARDKVKVPKRFINDTIRSDFHRKFLAKYIQ